MQLATSIIQENLQVKAIPEYFGPYNTRKSTKKWSILLLQKIQ